MPTLTVSQIRCTGQKAASEVIADLSPDSISPSGGYIKVKNTLQIADDRFGHIYAAGDVADSGAPKNGRSATAQAAFVSDNILRAVQGRPPLVYRTDYLMEGGIELTLGLVSSPIISATFSLLTIAGQKRLLRYRWISGHCSCG